MRSGALALLLACALASGARAQSTLEPETRAAALELSPRPPLAPDPTNEVGDDPDAALLGQRLFFDVRLSPDGSRSCATCHDPARAFTDGRAIPEARGPVFRHTPTLLDAAYQRWFFWDGRADSLQAQALVPIEEPRELASDRVSIARLLHDDATYRAAYGALFGALPPLDDLVRFPERGRPVPAMVGHPDELAWWSMTADDRDAVDRTFANVGKALAAYQRRLLTGPAPFDRFVEGLREDDPEKRAALSPAALRGLGLFVGKGRCVLCHSGPHFTDLEFHDLRLPPKLSTPSADPGRFVGIGLVLEDPFNGIGRHSDAPESDATLKLRHLDRGPHNLGEMKTPSLRNVALTAPYMHQGHFATLEEVIDYYSTLADALPAGEHAERLLRPRFFSAEEKRDLVAFLESLTGAPVPAELRNAPPR